MSKMVTAVEPETDLRRTRLSIRFQSSGCARMPALGGLCKSSRSIPACAEVTACASRRQPLARGAIAPPGPLVERQRPLLTVDGQPSSQGRPGNRHRLHGRHRDANHAGARGPAGAEQAGAGTNTPMQGRGAGRTEAAARPGTALYSGAIRPRAGCPESFLRQPRHRRIARGGAAHGPSAPAPASPRRSGWRGCPRRDRGGRRFPP